MNRIKILLIAQIVLCVAAATQAQGADDAKLGIDFDATWVSKYIWHGFDLFDDKAAIQPSFNIDLWGTGFSVNIWGSIPCSGGLVDLTEYDYTLAYSNTAFADELYATEYTLNWIYYDYPETRSRHADLQEFGVGFSWPELCPMDIVPSYYLGKLWPTRSNSDISDAAGFVHVFALGYDLAVPAILPGTDERVLSLFADFTYNDGYGSNTADHDWSHATLGVSTEIAIGDLTFTPSVSYQISMDDSVNDEDEVWAGLSFSYSF